MIKYFMSLIRLRRGSGSYEILKTAALISGVLILGGFVQPRVIIKDIMKIYERKRVIDHYRLLRDLRNLQKRGLISFSEGEGGTVRIVITKAGKKKFLEYKIDNMKLRRSVVWDKKWRVVLFDIPVKKNRARSALSRKLKDLGFYSLQKSVFISPYECEDEIDFIGLVFNVRKHILFLRIGSFDGDRFLKKYFGL